MHAGKLVFAQLMQHVSLHAFRQCVAKIPKPISNAQTLASRSVPLSSLRATDLRRDLTRHRNPSSRSSIPVLPPRHTMECGTLHTCRCQRISRLPHFADFAMSLIETVFKVYASDSFAVER